MESRRSLRVSHAFRTARAAAACACLLTAVASPVRAQDAEPPPLVKTTDIVLFGAFVAGTALIAPLDRAVAERLQHPQAQANRALRYPAAFFRETGYPGSVVIGGSLYAIGRLADERDVAALGLHGLEAILIGNLFARGVKSVVGRARPYVGAGPHSFGLMRGFASDSYRAFPSGHTVAAFAAATVVTQEAGRRWQDSELLIAPMMYGGAALVGVSRMYNNKHWASDVMMGAAIGTLAGVMVDRYHRTRPDNRWDRWFLGEREPAPGGPVVILLFSGAMPR